MTEARNMLTERDVALLCDLYKYRYLSVSQIRRLHFPSLQTAYRRLRALMALGLIKSFLAPHITEHIYYLDMAGAIQVAGSLGVEVSELRWTQNARTPKDYYFLRHFLAVSDFRIALTGACGESGIRLLGFIPEYYGEKSERGLVTKYIKDYVCDIGDHSRKMTHTPDAVFALEKNGRPALFFLEIDRGTEVIGDEEKGVLKCAKFYLNYLVGGQYRRYEADFGCAPFKGFRALIVTTSEQRVENIRQAVTTRLSFPDKARQFIWLASNGQVRVNDTSSGVFSSTWRSADAGDSTLYRIG